MGGEGEAGEEGPAGAVVPAHQPGLRGPRLDRQVAGYRGGYLLEHIHRTMLRDGEVGNHGRKPALKGRDTKHAAQPVCQRDEGVRGIGREIEDVLGKPAGGMQHKGEGVHAAEEGLKASKHRAIDLGRGETGVEQGDMLDHTRVIPLWYKLGRCTCCVGD